MLLASLIVWMSAVVLLPLTGLLRLAVFLLYLPLAFYALMLFTVGYVCSHYGRCL